MGQKTGTDQGELWVRKLRKKKRDWSGTLNRNTSEESFGVCGGETGRKTEMHVRGCARRPRRVGRITMTTMCDGLCLSVGITQNRQLVMALGVGVQRHAERGEVLLSVICLTPDNTPYTTIVHY